MLQPPPRGCVLKRFSHCLSPVPYVQPPPRGCVLKRLLIAIVKLKPQAAASARLCVETA